MIAARSRGAAMQRNLNQLLVAVVLVGVAALSLPPLAAQAVEGTYTFRVVAGKTDRSSGLRDGPAADAQFLAPGGITRGADGTIYVSEGTFFVTRRLQAGIVSTISSTVAGPMAVSVDGTLYVVTSAHVHRQTSAVGPHLPQLRAV